MSTKRVAVLGVHPITHEIGGAERFYQGLTAALNRAGADADYIDVLSDESTIETIKEAYLRCYDLDVAAYDGVISTKAPAYAVRHPNHICYLQHTMRVFYDMFDYEFPEAGEDMRAHRDLIRELDVECLKAPRTKTRFVIGHEVRNRLLRYNGLDANILHQGLTFDQFRTGDYRYLFLPSRLHRWKRVDLVIEAMKYVDRPLSLKLAGVGEDGKHFKQLAAADDRIEFLGRVTDDELVNLYADALAIPFMPIREDYGLVTPEAFRSRKPVITCTDSGEPAHLVKDRVSGFVCTPDPTEIAARITELFDKPVMAREMGEAGFASIAHITWDNVASSLLKALGFS